MKKTILIPAFFVALLVGLSISTPTMADHGAGKGEGSGHHKAAWKESLTKKQWDLLKKKKVAFLKKKYPAKARMKTIKIDLAVLSTADKPDQKAIDAKIDELLALKRNLLKAKYAHIISVRKELSPEQQVLFDKYRLKKAKRKKCRRHH